MKTSNHLVITTLLVTGLCMPATAQGIKKALTTLSKKAKTVQTIPAKSGPKRFYFPQNAAQLSQSLQRSLAATAQQAALESTAATKLPPLPQSPYLTFIKNASEKEFLSLALQEQQFYTQEINQANALLKQVKYVASFPGELSETDLTDLQAGLNFIPNDFLRNLLSDALARQDLKQFQEELSDYYTLGKSFEDAAFSYTLRHPHKRTLQLRRFMVNPFIDNNLKKPITRFLAAAQIPASKQGTFRNALSALNQAYQHLKEASLQAPGVQMQQAYYDQLIDEVETFVAKTGRLPKWNTRSAAERDLFNQVDFAISNSQDFSIPFLAEAKNQLKMVLAKYAAPHRSRNETLSAFESFVQTTGLMYPRALTESNTVLEGEEQLFDDLCYWRNVDERAITRQIQHIQSTHADPFLSNPANEFYYP